MVVTNSEYLRRLLLDPMRVGCQKFQNNQNLYA